MTVYIVIYIEQKRSLLYCIKCYMTDRDTAFLCLNLVGNIVEKKRERKRTNNHKKWKNIPELTFWTYLILSFPFVIFYKCTVLYAYYIEWMKRIILLA